MIARAAAYGFINAKLRARISKILPQEFFMRMARARSFIEAVGMLRETVYADVDRVYSQTGDLLLAELELHREEMAVVSELGHYGTDDTRVFASVVVQQYEVENLKNAIRLWFERAVRGRSVEQKVPYVMRRGTAHAIDFDALINAADLSVTASVLEKTPYAAIIRAHAAEVTAQSSVFPLEMALDRWYYRELLETADRLDRRDAEIAKRLIGIQIDVVNVNWVVRLSEYYDISLGTLRRSLLPGGLWFDVSQLEASFQSDHPADTLASTLSGRYPAMAGHTPEGDRLRSLALLEDVLQQVLHHEVHKVLGGYPFTIGIVLAYVFLKQNEIRSITTVLNGRYYELDPARIGSML
jgi:V/A-type H+/Na+-transporting ATPase subunit C